MRCRGLDCRRVRDWSRDWVQPCGVKKFIKHLPLQRICSNKKGRQDMHPDFIAKTRLVGKDVKNEIAQHRIRRLLQVRRRQGVSAKAKSGVSHSPSRASGAIEYNCLVILIERTDHLRL